MLRESPGDVLALVDHPDFARALSTPDHFIPLLYVAALAATSGPEVDVLVDGFAHGSLSKASYTQLPRPEAVPPEHRNA